MNYPMDGPTYDQIREIGAWQRALTERIANELQVIQSQGPTRISGMEQEIDAAAKAAIVKWAESLQA